VSRTKLQFDGEYKFHNYLQKSMSNCGWDVERESIPKRCLGWDKPHRADLICSSRTEEGSLVRLGLELKFFKSRRQGARLAKAVRQVIDNYQGRHFKCPTTGAYAPFDLFGLVVFFQRDYESDSKAGLEDLAGGFCREFGLGFGAAGPKSNRITVSFRNDLKYIPLVERSGYERTPKSIVQEKLKNAPVDKIRDFARTKQVTSE